MSAQQKMNQIVCAHMPMGSYLPYESVPQLFFLHVCSGHLKLGRKFFMQIIYLTMSQPDWVKNIIDFLEHHFENQFWGEESESEVRFCLWTIFELKCWSV
jgi:hypothetical protein